MSNLLTLTLTHEDHQNLCSALKITRDDYYTIKAQGFTGRPSLAARIMQARQALGLSNQVSWLLSDYVLNTDDELSITCTLPKEA